MGVGKEVGWRWWGWREMVRDFLLRNRLVVMETERSLQAQARGPGKPVV